MARRYRVEKDNYCTDCKNQSCAPGEKTCKRCKDRIKGEVNHAWLAMREKFYHESARRW